MHSLNNMKIFLVMLLMGVTLPLYAAVSPAPLSTDSRIRTVTYHPDEVYNLKGLHGYHTTIQLGDDEKIMIIDLGDTSAWTISAGINTVTIKPVADKADTNMTVRTDKRLYLFQLSTPPLQRDQNGVPIFGKSQNAVFLLKFHYPETIMGLGEPRSSIATGIINPPTKVINRFYTARGSKDILPRAVYDDGKFTYFDFTGIQPIPSIFTVDKKRHEYVINKRIEGEWVVFEGVERQFTLRYGNQVASVFNDMTVKK